MSITLGFTSSRRFNLVNLDCRKTYDFDDNNRFEESGPLLTELESITGLNGFHDTSINTLETIFRHLDKDKRGLLSINQFKSCLIYFGINLSDSKYWDFINSYIADDQKEETINYVFDSTNIQYNHTNIKNDNNIPDLTNHLYDTVDNHIDNQINNRYISDDNHGDIDCKSNSSISGGLIDQIIHFSHDFPESNSKINIFDDDGSDRESDNSSMCTFDSWDSSRKLQTDDSTDITGDNINFNSHLNQEIHFHNNFHEIDTNLKNFSVAPESDKESYTESQLHHLNGHIHHLDNFILDFSHFRSLLQHVLLMNLFRKSVVQQAMSKSKISKISLISISPEKIYFKMNIKDQKDLFFGSLPHWSTINWINISHLDLLTLKRMGIYFDLDLLTIENIVDSRFHSKIEINHDYFVLYLPLFEAKIKTKFLYDVKSVKIVVFREPSTTNNAVITISSLLFSKTKILINQPYSSTRKSFLKFLYHIIDEIFETNSKIINDLSSDIAQYERLLISDVKAVNMNDIPALKATLSMFKKSLKPIRQILEEIIKLYPEYSIYYEDIRNQLNSMIDDIKELNDTNKSIADQYNLTKANVLGEVMYLLTVVTTIFAPAQFITGVYGMNFTYMPEIGYKYSYLIFWIVVLSIFTLLSYALRRISKTFGV